MPHQGNTTIGSVTRDGHEMDDMDIYTTDRKARKKDQNRRAAINYRRKKLEEKNRMLEEEMKLVYSRVCLIGYAEELETTILNLLQTQSTKVYDDDGRYVRFLCLLCAQPCEDINLLRDHLNTRHYPEFWRSIYSPR